MLKTCALLKTVLALAALFFAICPDVRTQDSIERWENFNFTRNVVKPVEISKLPLEDLKLPRGIVFGRHGRVFKDAEIRRYR